MYSPTTRGFYDVAIHGDLMPGDAVEISDVEYEGLLAGQSAGRAIVTGFGGRPELQDRPAVPPSPAVLLRAALARGVAVTSASAPAVDGTYPVDAETTASITAVAQYITAFDAFPNDGPSLPWLDAGGAPHAFPDTAAFMRFARAAARYVTACRQAGMAAELSGEAPAFPDNHYELD